MTKEAFFNQSFLKLWGRNTIFKCTPPRPSPPAPPPPEDGCPGDVQHSCLFWGKHWLCVGASTTSSSLSADARPAGRVCTLLPSPPLTCRDHCVWGEGGIRSGTQMLWVLVAFLSAVCTAGLSCSLPSGLRSPVRETRDWSGSGNSVGAASLWGLDRSIRVTHPQCGSGMKRQVSYLTSHLD